jgi:hypothetical protein
MCRPQYLTLFIVLTHVMLIIIFTSFIHARLQVDPMPMVYSPSIDTQNNIVTVWEQTDNQNNKCLQTNIIFSTKQ